MLQVRCSWPGKHICVPCNAGQSAVFCWRTIVHDLALFDGSHRGASTMIVTLCWRESEMHQLCCFQGDCVHDFQGQAYNRLAGYGPLGGMTR